MKTITTILATAVMSLSVQTPLMAQVIFGDESITVLSGEKVLGDETTTSVYLPNIQSIGAQTLLATPNVRSIELGNKDRDDKIEIYNYGIDFFMGSNDLYDSPDRDMRFENIKNLTDFVMYQPGWCDYPFDNFWEYPGQLTFVPLGIGSGCDALEHVILPEKAQCIRNCFNDCNKLTTIAIPSSAGYISDSFNGCRSLQAIELHTGIVPEIVNSFTGLADDAVIYVPVGFKEVYENSDWGKLGYAIAENAEYDCGYTPDKLPFRGFEVLAGGKIDPESGLSLSEGARIGNSHYHFDGFDADGEPLFFNDAENETGCIKHYDISGYNTIEIADYTLCGSTMTGSESVIVTLNLPSTVERIGAFVGAYNDPVVIEDFNEGLRTIGRKALSNAHFAANEITLPSTLEYIGEAAFDGHDGLTTVRCAAMTPPMCADTRVFGDKSQLSLGVPPGAKDAYEAAPVWNTFGVIYEDVSLLSVGNIIADETVAGVEYFTVDGRKVSPENIKRGVYIKRSGATTTKVVI